MKIAAIDITRHRIALDPPVPVSWDSRPRGSFTITLVRVRTDEGLEGAPYLEFPFDPPDWVPARRDFYLEETIETDDEGWLPRAAETVPASAPTGLDEDVLRETRIG